MRWDTVQTMRRVGKVVAFTVFALTSSLVVADDRLDHSEFGSESTAGQVGLLLAQPAASLLGGNGSGAVTGAADALLRYGLPNLLQDAPVWAQRFEIEWDMQDGRKPELSILTVQPLYESDGKQHTVFTQLRLAHNYQFGDARTTANIGVGFRRLFRDNTVLLGANSFLDHEWRERHSRISVGGEARWSGFDFYTNWYKGVSGNRSLGSGRFEEALDGYDLELTAQLPYLQWARVRGRRFFWDTNRAANNVKGWSGSFELDLLKHLQIEFGISDDNFGDRDTFLQIRFVSWSPTPPTMASSSLVDKQAYRLRDMSDYTLKKVRRENEIVVERFASGVVIVRGN